MVDHVAFIVSNKPIITWQGTHYEFTKLIISANVSCLDLNIHKPKDVVPIKKPCKNHMNCHHIKES